MGISISRQPTTDLLTQFRWGLLYMSINPKSCNTGVCVSVREKMKILVLDVLNQDPLVRR